MTGATMTEAGTPASTRRCERLEPLVGRACPRLHGARELAVERRHRQRHFHQAPLGHRRQQVEIAQDESRLGDDADGMVRRAQHFEDAAHDAIAPLDRLIGIGVGADGDGPHLIAGLGQLPLERLRGVGLGEQPGLEVEPRRKAEKGVGRAARSSRCSHARSPGKG